MNPWFNMNVALLSSTISTKNMLFQFLNNQKTKMDCTKDKWVPQLGKFHQVYRQGMWYQRVSLSRLKVIFHPDLSSQLKRIFLSIQDLLLQIFIKAKVRVVQTYQTKDQWAWISKTWAFLLKRKEKSWRHFSLKIH